MNNEIEYEKVIEWTYNNVLYLVRLKIDSKELNIEVEEKYTGYMWTAMFTMEAIEELTYKAKGPKKYSIFIRMLISSFNAKSESVKVEILSYGYLQKKIQGNSNRKPQQPLYQQNKKYIILTYLNEFDKIQYPLSLKYEYNITKLKYSIRRLAQYLIILGESRSYTEYFRDLSLMKQENYLLRNKIKSYEMSKHKVDSLYHENLLKKNEECMQQIQLISRILYQKEGYIVNLKTTLSSLQLYSQHKTDKLKYLATIVEQKDKSLSELLEVDRKNPSHLSSQSNQLSELYPRIDEILNEMYKMTKYLQHAKYQDKKSKLKIVNLYRELEQMITNKKSIKRYQSPDYPLKSEKSVKSHHSGQSNNSKRLNQNTKNNRSKVNINANAVARNSRKSSVYDSDTESSRLRKYTNSRTSPFRQLTRPNNLKTNTVSSGKKTPRNSNPLIQKLNRSRSRSRDSKNNDSLEMRESQSQMMTDNYEESDSDSYTQRANKALAKLYYKRSKKEKFQLNSTKISAVEKKIQSIEYMIRNTKNATRK